MKNLHSSHSNKIANPLLKYVVLVYTASLLFTGCGQRGSLYLPTAPEAVQRSSMLETLVVPTTTNTADTDKNSTASTRSPMTSPTTPAAK